MREDGVYGKDFDRKLGKAQAVVAEVEAKSPGFAAFLNVSGRANDAMLTSFLVTIAEQKGR